MPYIFIARHLAIIWWNVFLRSVWANTRLFSVTADHKFCGCGCWYFLFVKKTIALFIWVALEGPNWIYCSVRSSPPGEWKAERFMHLFASWASFSGWFLGNANVELKSSAFKISWKGSSLGSPFIGWFSEIFVLMDLLSRWTSLSTIFFLDHQSCSRDVLWRFLVLGHHPLCALKNEKIHVWLYLWGVGVTTRVDEVHCCSSLGFVGDSSCSFRMF